MKNKRRKALITYMQVQKEWCPKCNNYDLLDEWQIDAMIRFADIVAQNKKSNFKN